MMKKYLQVVTSTWGEISTYRFNFTMWRIRNVLQLLTVYFLWLTVTPVKGQLFGYSQPLILTYVLGVSLISSVVLSTRTAEIGENIDSGNLSLFLVRPLNYFLYWFARDLGDKAVNIVFVIVELFLFFLILKPPLFIQSHASFLLLTLIAIALALLLNFFIGCLLGFVGFWSSEVWAPRFIYFILIGFLSGGAFPLDIFPQWLQGIFHFSPFTYLLYFPLKIYLGALSPEQIAQGMLIAVAWVAILYFATKVVWLRGLKVYSAQGN